jgi:hypothetical protein
MTELFTLDSARPGQLRRDGACLREGVARRPWMAGGMGTDDARSHHQQPARHQPQRVVEKVGRSITNSETPQTSTSRSTTPSPPRGSSNTNESGKRAQGNKPACRQGPSAILCTGHTGTNERRGVTGRPANPRSFSRRPHGRPRPRLLCGFAHGMDDQIRKEAATSPGTLSREFTPVLARTLATFASASRWSSAEVGYLAGL